MTSEAEHTTTIVKAATILGYRVAHFRPARTVHGWRTAMQGHAGFPDLLIAGHGRLFVVELKHDAGRKPTRDQVAWLAELSRAGVDARVVHVPSGQQSFIDELTEARTLGEVDRVAHEAHERAKGML